MRDIRILAQQRDLEALAQWLRQQCAGEGCFPRVSCHDRATALLDACFSRAPDCLIVALPGVAGLSAVEAFRKICPEAFVIWISDLDFSLQAFRLRVTQFHLGAPEEGTLRSAVSACLEKCRDRDALCK